MHLASFTYGKARVRIMRVKRDTARHEVRELELQVMLEGDFSASFLSNDNSKVVATDTIKNIVNIVACDNTALETEDFIAAIADYFFNHYRHIHNIKISALETKWARLNINGEPHDHAFLKDANGRNHVTLTTTRATRQIASGVENYTFLKSTASGWVGYWMDEATTLKETTDRIFSTSMDASWVWSAAPANYPQTNEKIIVAMMKTFASIYSPSVQNSLFLMGSAALAAVPEIGTISLACPNKHYLPINMAPFHRENPNIIFTPTDEPHGQIECTIVRDS
ncbi:MAG TPA: urate oxidase [Halothiobacillus sp.]|nr:urate oxidase [Halothiobacillus sp.]